MPTTTATPTAAAAHAPQLRNTAIHNWYAAQPSKALRLWHDKVGADATPEQVFLAASKFGAPDRVALPGLDYPQDEAAHALPALDWQTVMPAALTATDTTTAPAALVRPFIHTPRPALQQSTSDRHTARRSFGSVGSTNPAAAVGISSRTGNPTEFIFYRSALLDTATLELAVCGRVRSVLNIRMGAADLRAMAALAIDAANDLETHSANALAAAATAAIAAQQGGPA